MREKLSKTQKQLVLRAADCFAYVYDAFPVCVILRDRETGDLGIVTGENVANIELTRVLRQASGAMISETWSEGPETQI